jgi:uncharacterized Tic20 family protein
MLCHLASFLVFIPFGHILGPLIVWKIKREQHPMIDHHGKESVNFRISVTIYLFACIPLIFIIIGVPIMILIGLGNVVLTLIAALQASNGVPYRYPLTIRLIK